MVAPLFYIVYIIPGIMHVTKNGQNKSDLQDYPFISQQYKSFTTNGFYLWAIFASAFSTYPQNVARP